MTSSCATRPVTLASMSGPKQDIEPRLGFATTDLTRLYRNVKLLIDGGLRTIGEASLGSANVAFLTLKALELRQLAEARRPFYVGFTRAKTEVHLVHTSRRASPFVDEVQQRLEQ